jgi:hypothetical protein
VSYVDHVRGRFPDKAELLDKMKHHNELLPSPRPSVQRMRLALNGKKGHRKCALKEARAVETEHAVVLQYLDVCTQELNLHTDPSNFHPQSSVASKAIGAARQNVEHMPFYDVSSLAKWEVVGSPATTMLSTEGKQTHFCTLTDLNVDAGTCSVKFNGGVVCDGVLLTDLHTTPDSSVCLR